MRLEERAHLDIADDLRGDLAHIARPAALFHPGLACLRHPWHLLDEAVRRAVEITGNGLRATEVSMWHHE